MRKLIAVAIVAGFVLSAMPAGAAHPASVVVTHAFAGTCGGNAKDGDPFSGTCIFGSDALWEASGSVIGPTDCKGGAEVSGCGQGVYIPGFGPPVRRPTTAMRTSKTGCDNTLDDACWNGGNFLQTTAHPAATCQTVSSNGAAACENVARGSFYRPVSGIGAYSGTSEGCGRIRTTTSSPATTAVSDLGWIHSAGTMLPITMRMRTYSPGGGNHTGTSIFSLTNARPIRNELGEPPGLGNGGLPSATDPNLGPGKSGTRRFGVTGFAVTLPGNGAVSVGDGQNWDTWCPDLAIS